MLWLDICGAPGSGKSTLADKLWAPHELPINQHALPPADWHDFVNEISRLFYLIQRHPTFSAAIRMNNRSIRKMATVARTSSEKSPYIQTGLVQRGLGFGWRMNQLGINLRELEHFFRLMPVSLGVVVTRCGVEENKKRNRDRLNVQETAHENRDFMVPLMEPCIDLAIGVLRNRGVPVTEISTEQPIEAARRELVSIADKAVADHVPSLGADYAPEALSPPPWWV